MDKTGAVLLLLSSVLVGWRDYRFSNTRLGWWDMLANLCLLLMSVCCSFEWWKRAVCNVWYRCLDQLKQTACLKLLWKICNSITLSSMKVSAIGSLSFMYLEVCMCSTILFPAVGRTWKNCHRKTIVKTNFFVALLWCGRHINNTVLGFVIHYIIRDALRTSWCAHILHTLSTLTKQ